MIRVRGMAPKNGLEIRDGDYIRMYKEGAYLSLISWKVMRSTQLVGKSPLTFDGGLISRPQSLYYHALLEQCPLGQSGLSNSEINCESHGSGKHMLYQNLHQERRWASCNSSARCYLVLSTMSRWCCTCIVRKQTKP